MKKEEKLRELEAMDQHFQTILVDRIKEKGCLAFDENGVKDMANIIRSVNSTIKHLNEIDDVVKKETKINLELDPYGEENWDDDDEPKSSLLNSIIKKATTRELFGSFPPRKRPADISIENVEDTDTNSYFDVDNIVNNAGPLMTTHDIQRSLANKVQLIQNRFHCPKIISNGNLISVLQDIFGYTINPVNRISEVDTNIPFPMGQIGTLKLYIDAYMRWDDNRILFYVNEDDTKENFIHTLNVRDTNGILI